MSGQKYRLRRGREIGAAVAMGLLTTVAAVAAAGPEYLDRPGVGLPLAGAAGMLALATGMWWDRRSGRLQAHRDQQVRWREAFAAGPATPRLDDAPVGTLAGLLAPHREVVPYEKGRLPAVVNIRSWCTDRRPGVVWQVSGGPGTGKTRLAMRVAASDRDRDRQPWTCGWVRRGQAAVAVEVAAMWPTPC